MPEAGPGPPCSPWGHDRLNMAAAAQFRPDIQGLRALSVILVLVYHVFPAAMPGGYVGVDVFFVISGFLITGILLKQAESEGRIAFLTFYMRRLRRLAPAATVTLAVAGAASLIILPELYWRDTAFEILAAAFYVENFYLFGRSVDYLAEDSAPTLFQHYWSLSIEEQFYIVWPALIALTIWLARRAGLSLRQGMMALSGVIVLSSFTVSAGFTADTDGAYFLTHFRVWELALGGFLAAGLPYLRLSALTRTVTGWAGAVMIVAAALTFSAQTVFPGYAALLPVLGAALLLAAGGQGGMAGLGWLLSNRVARFIGDRSYSIYLVHWPPVIFALVRNDGEMSLLTGLGVMVLSVLLADLSYRFVETPFRQPGCPVAAGLGGEPGPVPVAGQQVARARLSLAGPLVLPAWTFGMCLVTAVGLLGASAIKEGQAVRMEVDAYPGARALLHPERGRAQEGLVPVPPLERARGDNAAVYRDRCHRNASATEPRACVYGVADGARTVVLVGDSTAAQWLPALETVAERQGWRVVSHSKSSCGFIGVAMPRRRGEYEACTQWNAALLDQLLSEPPDLVITTMSPRYSMMNARNEAARRAGYADGLTQVWNALAQAGVPVAVIRPTPGFAFDVLECYAANTGDPERCGAERSDVLPVDDAVSAAVPLASRAYLLDLTDGICSPERCEAVVGNVIVYRDRHHLTATYTRTLSDAFEQRLQAIVQEDAARHGVEDPLFAPALLQ